MKGFIYRIGVALKDRGERRGRTWLVRLGCRVKDLVMGRRAV
jgi:hypothetical protein